MENNLDLSKLKADFKPYFHTRVLGAIERTGQLKAWPSLKSILVPSLTIAAVLLAIVYVQHDNVSVDALLGMKDYDPNSFTEYLDNYYE